MAKLHRKLVKHYEAPGDARELTFSCYGRMPLLTNERWQRYLAECIGNATERHGFDLVAFVFMPEHVHLLVVPRRKASTVSVLLGAIKRPLSFRVKKELSASKGPLLNRLTIPQRPGVMTFRFWQEGPGYDRNITEPSTVISAIDYIHMNPVRRGLCFKAVDWKWSSARRFIEPEAQIDPVLPPLGKLPPEFLE
ncbi:MAG: transposase [Pirellulales bacterium]